MILLRFIYEKVKNKPAPYYYNYSIFTVIAKYIRKYICQVIAPNCIFNRIRIFLYRICGIKIGKYCFIGMKCYFDDTCYDKIEIGNGVTISYGVYLSCHGKRQGAYPIVIGDGAYIGMGAGIIGKNSNGTEDGVHIGNKAIIGAYALVNKDIPPNATAVGVPCRVIKKEPCV